MTRWWSPSLSHEMDERITRSLYNEHSDLWIISIHDTHGNFSAEKSQQYKLQCTRNRIMTSALFECVSSHDTCWRSVWLGCHAGILVGKCNYYFAFIDNFSVIVSFIGVLDSSIAKI